MREVMGIRAWGNEGGEADEDSEGGVVVGWVRRRRKQEKTKKQEWSTTSPEGRDSQV